MSLAASTSLADCHATPWRVQVGASRLAIAGPLAAGLVLAALAFFRKVERSEFQKVYVAAAARMQQGECIHFRVKDAYAYPPFMALAATPLVGLPKTVSLSIWFSVCIAAASWGMWNAWRLARGETPTRSGSEAASNTSSLTRRVGIAGGA